MGLEARGTFYCTKMLHVFVLLTVTNVANPGNEIASSGDEIRYVVHYIPRCHSEYLEQTKHINCSNGTVPIFALSSTKSNETYLVCAKDKIIPDKACLEYNDGRVQGRLLDPAALCENFTLTPCKSPYQASKSYELFECFSKLGGIKNAKQLYEDLEGSKAELAGCKEMGLKVDKELETWKTVAIAFIVMFFVASCATIILLYMYLCRVSQSQRRHGSESMEMLKKGKDFAPFKAETGNGNGEQKCEKDLNIDVKLTKQKLTSGVLTTY